MPRPLSPATLQVLKAIIDGQRFGFDIMDATGLPSGTVYPILSRAERSGMVRAKWEAASLAKKEQRPRRRYYELTATGSRALTEAIEHYRAFGSAIAGPLMPVPKRG